MTLILETKFQTYDLINEIEIITPPPHIISDTMLLSLKGYWLQHAVGEIEVRLPGLLGDMGTFKKEVSRGQVQRQGGFGSLDLPSLPLCFSSHRVFLSSFRGVG